MKTTEKTFGACRYCGQLLNIKSYLALHPNIGDPDEDGIATLICDCKEARRDRDTHEAALRGENDRIEALQKAEDVIEELFAGNPHQKRRMSFQLFSLLCPPLICFSQSFTSDSFAAPSICSCRHYPVCRQSVPIEGLQKRGQPRTSATGSCSRRSRP